MKLIFADTFYWIALINPKDDWHNRVVNLTRNLQQVKIVTTDEVLTEVLNFLSTYGIQRRQKTVKLIKDIMVNPNILVVQQTRDSFLHGLNLYENRLDKEYSLTDCISMEVMKQLNITEILTHDKHFSQEGFMLIFRD